MTPRPPDIELDNPFGDDPETRDCQWLVLHYWASPASEAKRPASQAFWAIPWAHLCARHGLLVPVDPLAAADLVGHRIVRAFGRKIEELGLSNMPPFSALMTLTGSRYVDSGRWGRVAWRSLANIADTHADRGRAALLARAWIDEILAGACPWIGPALERHDPDPADLSKEALASFVIGSARARLESLDIERSADPARASARPARM